MNETQDYTAALPAKPMAAGVLFFNRDDHVLLVEPVYKRGWEFPGGVVMTGESPWAGAVREVKEELGLIVRGPLPLLVADWMPARAPQRDAVRWLFDGGRLTEDEIAAIVLPPDELRAFRFVAPQDAPALLPPERVRRLNAALAARGTGAAYLEDGCPLS